MAKHERSLRFRYWLQPTINPWYKDHLLGAELAAFQVRSLGAEEGLPSFDEAGHLAAQGVLIDFQPRTGRPGSDPDRANRTASPRRFETYRELLRINPEFDSQQTHQALSDEHERRYLAGEHQAIFDYVRCDRWAFRAKWVVGQIEAWHAEQSSQMLKDLMSAYAVRRSPKRPKAVRAIIRRDQALFRAVVKRQEDAERSGYPESLSQTFAIVGGKAKAVSTETVKIVYRHYWPLYHLVVKDQPHFTGKQFFSELEAMLRRLEGTLPRISGSSVGIQSPSD